MLHPISRLQLPDDASGKAPSGLNGHIPSASWSRPSHETAHVGITAWTLPTRGVTRPGSHQYEEQHPSPLHGRPHLSNSLAMQKCPSLGISCSSVYFWWTGSGVYLWQPEKTGKAETICPEDLFERTPQAKRLVHNMSERHE